MVAAIDIGSTETSFFAPMIEDDLFDECIKQVLDLPDASIDEIESLDDSVLLHEPSLLDGMPLLQESLQDEQELSFLADMPLLSEPPQVLLKPPEEEEKEEEKQPPPKIVINNPVEERPSRTSSTTTTKVRVRAFPTIAHQLLRKEEPQDPSALMIPLMRKPKRCLTAYNLFFQDERQRLLETLPVKNGKKKPRRSHGKIGFAEMARTVSAAWKQISKEDKMEYEYQAELDRERYERELAEWKQWCKTTGYVEPSKRKAKK